MPRLRLKMFSKLLYARVRRKCQGTSSLVLHCSSVSARVISLCTPVAPFLHGAMNAPGSSSSIWSFEALEKTNTHSPKDESSKNVRTQLVHGGTQRSSSNTTYVPQKFYCGVFAGQSQFQSSHRKGEKNMQLQR